MWLFGPFNFVLDLVWMGADAEQQSLRDCYAGTYLVRRSAEPIGVGPLHLTYYCGAGMTLIYPRVIHLTLSVPELTCTAGSRRLPSPHSQAGAFEAATTIVR